MPFMYWSRPRCYPSHVQAIYLNVSIMAFYYVDSADTFTITMSWLSIKLTWAAPITVAAIKVVDAHLPLYFFIFIFILVDHSSSSFPFRAALRNYYIEPIIISMLSLLRSGTPNTFQSQLLPNMITSNLVLCPLSYSCLSDRCKQVKSTHAMNISGG